MTTRPPIIIPPAIEPLAAEKRWVVWKLKWVTGKDGKRKPTKPPFCADAPNRHASSTDPSTWCDLKTAMLAYTEERCDGIGFALLGSDIGAVDLDDCRDCRTGVIHSWALDAITRSGSYAEVTPSNEGVRVIGLAAGAHLHRKFTVPNANGVSCELYRRAERYITITGQQIGAATNLSNIDVLLDKLLAELDGAQEKSSTGGVGHGARRRHNLDSLIKDGCGEDFGGDRSRAVWYVIKQLLKQGRAADDIVTLLLDRSNGISAHIYDHQI